jgi:hypothetical protein
MIETEGELFWYLKGRYFKDLEKSKDVMSKYDCFSRQYKTIIELKCRRVHYDELMIEKIKYDFLASIGCKALYINSTPKGVYSFDISEMKPEWITDSTMPKNTDIDNSDERREKTYALINVSKAKLI